MNKSARAAANRLLYKYIPDAKPTYAKIKKIIEEMQFTVVPYTKHDNNEIVERLIDELNVRSETQLHNSFVYVRSNLRFVFINSELTEFEKCRLLCHELGHISDPDFLSAGASGSRIEREEFANEFSFCLNNPGVLTRCMLFVKRRKAVCAAVAALVVLGTAGAVTYGAINGSHKGETAAVYTGTVTDAEGIYYVTPGGSRFHRAWCGKVKERNDLTGYSAKQALERGYTPCKLCIGDEKLD